MSLSFSDFIYTQRIRKIPKPTESFAGKTVIVTGGNSGLGKEAVKHFIRLKARKVIIGCRSTSKGKAAKLAIETALKCSPDIIEIWEVDLESPATIIEFIARVNKLSRLDAFINNAGIMELQFKLTNGVERTLAVNVIGTFLLALQIVPKLKETASVYGVTPHLTFLGSALYSVAKYPENPGADIFTYLSDKDNVDIMNQYNLSKQLLTFIIVKLATIVDPLSGGKSSNPHPIIINCLDPCFCKTELASDSLSPALKVAGKVFQFLFARTAEEGSRLVVIAASAGRETHGGYMRAGNLLPYAPFVTSVEGVEKGDYLWELLGRKLEEIQPGVLANVS
ncbi:hypothetical protein G7Y89_g4681 [Cudoniella acicularis]|uniref:NAD(P)-binding protein n=1 Tax=Cudoniella acicularis TaxID=354080 RepID=A0A8H4RQ93_9HELO|nr:hypothetical protein G7Y89_g4681 [Cudoniella acicularis]